MYIAVIVLCIQIYAKLTKAANGNKKSLCVVNMSLLVLSFIKNANSINTT